MTSEIRYTIQLHNVHKTARSIVAVELISRISLLNNTSSEPRGVARARPIKNAIIPATYMFAENSPAYKLQQICNRCYLSLKKRARIRRRVI